jgi:ABC-type transport system involved in multi-copper enzyme maturation permease subunit
MTASLLRIRTLAANTVREAVRNRVLYVLLFFALVLIGTGVLLSTLTYVERERTLQDVGLASIRLFGAAIALFVGVGLIHKEVDRRTIFTILSKPVARSEFLVGKFAGLVVTIWLQVAVMAVCFVAVSSLAGAPVNAGHAKAVVLVGGELALLVAVATLFSSFTTPMLASFFGAGFYVVGHLTRDLRELGAQSGSPQVERATALLHRVLPDLEAFNVTIEAVHGLPIPPEAVWQPLLYGVCYSASLLLLAALVFERRDFR